MKKYEKIIEKWNEMAEDYEGGPSKVRFIKSGSPRAKKLKARIEEYGEEAIFEAIEKYRESTFLIYGSGTFKADFDWLLTPTYFPRVLEDRYKSKVKPMLKAKKNEEAEVIV